MVLYLNHMAINCTGHNIEKNKIWTKQIITLTLKLHKSTVISISEKQDTARHNRVLHPSSEQGSLPSQRYDAEGSSKTLVPF